MKNEYRYVRCKWCGTAFFKEHARLDGKEKKCPMCGHAGLFTNVPEDETKPRWVTAAQYEKRMGKPWPDDCAVYYRNPIDFAWYLMLFSDAKERIGGRVWMLNKVVICATEAGRPPDNWLPEGDSNA